MPIATDPLSLLFIACFLFGLLFMVVGATMGSLGHGAHATGHGASHGAIHSAHAGHMQHVEMMHRTVPNVKGAVRMNPNHTATHNATLFAYLNPTTVALFLLGFGLFGYLSHTTVNFVLPLTLLLACIGGLVITGLLLALLNRAFGNSEGETIQDVSDRTGLTGKVSITIQENGIGEVLYVSPGGMRKSTPARTVDGRRLERDQEVIVVSHQQGIAEVDTWEHFINPESIKLEKE